MELAGLCHDLGHGPFSHVFENELLPRLGVKHCEWKHEDMSELVLAHLVDENGLDLECDFYGLGSGGGMREVCELIRGREPVAEGAVARGGDGGEEDEDGFSPGAAMAAESPAGGLGPGVGGGGAATGGPFAASEGRSWMFDVVANKRNGIDVDKFDYLVRDAHCTGVRISTDPRRIMHFSRVANQGEG